MSFILKRQKCHQKTQKCPVGYLIISIFFRSNKNVTNTNTNTNSIAISLKRIERVRDWGIGSWFYWNNFFCFCSNFFIEPVILLNQLFCFTFYFKTFSNFLGWVGRRPWGPSPTNPCICIYVYERTK